MSSRQYVHETRDRRLRPRDTKRWYRCVCGLWWGKNKHFRCTCLRLPPVWAKKGKSP